jgi:pyruvate formate lyase activating enzyme
VLDAVRLMWQRGIWVEVTTLLIPGHNDRDDELKALAGFLAGLSPDLPWHVSRYHPDYEFDEAPVTPADRIFRAVEIGETAGLRYVYAGNLRAGEHENTRCPACKATVIARTGFYVGSRNLKGSACGACGARLPITVAP